MAAGAYSQRERHALSMEQDGKIAFHYVENDGTPDNMMRCCPCMPSSP